MVLKLLLTPLAAGGARWLIRHAPTAWIRRLCWTLVWRRVAHRLSSRRVVRSVHDFRMEVGPSDLIESTVLLTGQWEPALSVYLASALAPGDVCVDVGANVGFHSLLAASLVGQTGRVYAFEASPSVFRRLVRNIALNEMRQISARHVAIAAEPGRVSLYLAGQNNIGHSTTVETLAASEGMVLEAMVEADTLPNLVPAEDLWRARVIKIDVEGGERAVLAPLAPLMDRFGPDTEWMVELAPRFARGGQADVDWVFTLFTGCGYLAYAFDLPELPPYAWKRLTSVPLRRLSVAPTEEITDVLFSRRELTEV